MADQSFALPVLDQPGCAVGALEPMAAFSAESEGRIAPTIDEQHRLLTGCQGPGYRCRQGWGDESTPRRRVRSQIDNLDAGHRGTAVTVRQVDAAVACGSDIHIRLQRRRRGCKDDRAFAQPCPHHRHVAGVVTDAVLLLEAAVMFLIDHNQSEIGKRQEQGGAGTNDNLRATPRHGPPGLAAAFWGDLRMPDCGGRTKAFAEALEPLRGQGDFRQQDQDLTTVSQCCGDRLKIDLGLARARHTGQMGYAEPGSECRDQPLCPRCLIRGQVRSGSVEINAGQVLFLCEGEC